MNKYFIYKITAYLNYFYSIFKRKISTISLMLTYYLESYLYIIKSLFSKSKE